MVGGAKTEFNGVENQLGGLGWQWVQRYVFSEPWLVQSWEASSPLGPSTRPEANPTATNVFNADNSSADVSLGCWIYFGIGVVFVSYSHANKNMHQLLYIKRSPVWRQFSNQLRTNPCYCSHALIFDKTGENRFLVSSVCLGWVVLFFLSLV